jgi:hypothetical protein
MKLVDLAEFYEGKRRRATEWSARADLPAPLRSWANGLIPGLSRRFEEERRENAEDRTGE